MLVDVHGVPIEFPFQPYDCQKKFMEMAISALKSQQNACLESPTGTGKTLSLLCSALAFVQAKKSDFKLDPAKLIELQMLGSGMKAAESKGGIGRTRLFPQVIYASRTHSQLKQVVRELNKTIYKATTSVAILAGRDQLCLNDKVKKQANSNLKSQMCRQLVSSKKCFHHNNLNKSESAAVLRTYADEGNGDVMDLEDLVKAGQKHQHCPFFLNRGLQENADLVLLPYNYILDPKIREVYKINLTGNIIIFDEAHNLGSIAEESVSIALSSQDVALCIREAQKILEKMVETEESKREEFENSELKFHEMEAKKSDGREERKARKEDVAQFLEFLMKLEEELDEFGASAPKLSKPVPDLPGYLFPGLDLLKLLNRAGFTTQNASAIGTLIDRMGSFVVEHAVDENGHHSVLNEKTDKLSEFSVFLSRLFSIGSQNANDESAVFDLFRLYVTSTESGGFRLDFWCFSPAIAMQYMQGRRPLSILLASGTLAPIPHFVESMGIAFPFVLENGHAAQPDQIMVRPIQKAPNKTDLLGTYSNRDDNAYVQGIGQVVAGLARAVPQGMLVFFPSYSQMRNFLNNWKSGDLWNSVAMAKKPCVEPTARTEVSLVFREFDLAVRSGQGAVMFAVCRGKMSEGIDFADCHCRAVVVVGIPYPPVREPRVVLKKTFLAERLAKNRRGMGPDEWYRVEAVRAVNQALGRIVRHKDDFGVVVLADSRFATLPLNSFPRWIRPSFRAEADSHRLFAEIRRFFVDRETQVNQSMKSAAVHSIPFGNPLKRTHLTVGGDLNKKLKPMGEILDMYTQPSSSGCAGQDPKTEPKVIPTTSSTRSAFFSSINSPSQPQPPTKRRALKISTAKSAFTSNAPKKPE